MEENLKKFARILEEALKAADDAIDQGRAGGKRWLVEEGQTAKRVFLSLLEDVRHQRVRPSQGAGFGISRALGDAGVPDALYKAGCEVESYYKRHF